MGNLGIVENAISCRDSLNNFVAAARSKDFKLSKTEGLRDVEQLRERFGQWAGNLGALQPASSSLSLEHRLRDSPVVRDAVLKLLGDLLESLQMALDIATGRRNNRAAEPLVDSDTDLAEYGLSSSESDSDCDSAMPATRDGMETAGATSELDELMSSIRSGIDNLFKTSIFIRKHSPKDKQQRASATKPFDNRADVMYISDRYPLVAAKNEALGVRLGEANARRRQYFKYCRDHNDRLSRPNMEEGFSQRQESQAHPAPQPADPRLGIKATGSVVSEQTRPSLLADTEATEFLAQPFDKAGLFEQLDAQSAPSMVSFATSVAEVSENSLAFPPLPSEAENNSTFLCPYCCTVIWNPTSVRFPDVVSRHIRQHAWFDHELLVHRNLWACPKCSASLESPKSLEQHIIGHHSQDVPAKQIPAVTEMARRRPESILPSECPFCDGAWASAETDAMSTGEVVVNIDQFRKHLGHHLQQIALFSLPRPNREQEMESNAAGFAPDQDTMSAGWTLPYGFGRGWSLIFSKRATLTTLASFLAL
ncbi:hypothetical protein C8A01DRAFT_14606, partial [Parachaetomium inaequale]